MRTTWTMAALLLTIGVARANPPAPLVNPAGPAAANDAAVDAVLQQLDQVGSKLKEFSANLKLSESDTALGNTTTRQGKIWLQKRPDGSARIHVLFDLRIDDQQQIAHREKVEYLLDGPWLIDRNYQTRNEVKRQVLKPGQKMNLFKLGEGPFPLPIGQNPREVRRAFDVKRVAPAKDDPPHTVHLELTPKPNTDLARKFHSLDVWVDNTTHMPARVDTLDVKQQTSRSTQLSGIVINPPGGLKEGDFQLPNIDKENWNRHVEQLAE